MRLSCLASVLNLKMGDQSVVDGLDNDRGAFWAQGPNLHECGVDLKAHSLAVFLIRGLAIRLRLLLPCDLFMVPALLVHSVPFGLDSRLLLAFGLFCGLLLTLPGRGLRSDLCFLSLPGPGFGLCLLL